MTAKTHMMGGLLAAQLYAIARGSGGAELALIAACSVAGSLVPDIDHFNSKISRSSAAARITSAAVSVVTHHRGFIHTPLFVAAVAIALTAVSFFGLPHGYLLMLSLVIGMLSHLLLDTLNPGGIMWLFPFSRKRLHLLSIRTNSVGEIVVLLLLTAINIWLAGEDLLPAALAGCRQLIAQLREVMVVR